MVTGYWLDGCELNPSVMAIGRGLHWRGEIAVVQEGSLVPFYKKVKNPSYVDTVVARSVVVLPHCSGCSLTNS